jgi:RND family efflux transporter MFP subunit
MRGAIRLFGFGATSLLFGCGAQPAPVTSEKPQVRIAQVGAEATIVKIESVGTVALQRETSLGFTSAGRIARLSVNEGDSVRAGQVLAALDATTTGADLAAAGAERDRAAAEYARSSKLLADGWVTRPRVESARAALQVAEARVRTASFQTRNAVIAAPGAGTVLARLAEPGQVVAAGTPVLVLGERASGFVLRLPLSDRDAARVRVGAPATVRLAAVDGELAGQVREIAGRADRTTGTFAVEIALPDDPRLRSGQIGSASIIANGGSIEAIAVPPAAVFAPRAGQGFVYVVDLATKRVKLRRVTLAEASDSAIRVTGGLAKGEWVATSRIDRLTDNAAVEPIGAAK